MKKGLAFVHTVDISREKIRKMYTVYLQELYLQAAILLVKSSVWAVSELHTRHGIVNLKR